MKTLAFNSNIILNHNLRIDGRHYLNKHAINSLCLEQNKEKCKQLSELAYLFNPPRFKHQSCKCTPKAVKFFQSSDVQNSSENSTTYIFGGQAKALNLLVYTGDILVTGYGTIGNVRLVSRFQDGVSYADNVCRIRVNENIKRGYIYAFMSSKYGVSQLNKNASGSVVRYIEAPGIGKTLIPQFPDAFQEEVDNLIQESARLRDEATEALDKAKNYLNITLKSAINDNMLKFKSSKVNSKEIWCSLQHRLDPPALINDGVIEMKRLQRNFDYIKLGEANVKVYRPGIFKRCYVKSGYPYIKGSDIFDVNPFMRCTYLSRSKTPFVEEMLLHEGQILITCAGTVGAIKLITREYDDKGALGSQDIIRLESKDEILTTGFLFTYLQLPFVQSYIQSMKYGSVIERIEPFHVESIPILKPTKDISDYVTDLIQGYMSLIYRAFCNEEKAISMVENEIESWAKSWRN